MYIDIEIEQSKDMLCYDTVLATIAKWYKRDYEMIFTGSWNFYLRSESLENVSSIGEIFEAKIPNLEKNLEMYHGIKSETLPITSNTEFEELIIKSMIECEPIVVLFNSKFSPWAPQNLKESEFMTPYIISGINDNEIQCLDVHYLKGSQAIDKEFFFKGCGQFFKRFIKVSEHRKPDLRQFVQEVTKYLHIDEQNNNFSNIDKLAKIISEVNFEEEFRDINNPIESSLFNSLFIVQHNRAVFAMTFNYLFRLYDRIELENLALGLEKTSSKWNSIKSILLKAFLYNKTDKILVSKIVTKMREVCSLEKELFQQLKLLLGESDLIRLPTTELKTISSDKLFCRKQEHVDLNHLFNDKAFINIEKDIFGNFGMIGKAFLIDQVIMNNELKLGDIKFNMCQAYKKEYDNVSCMGQEIVADVDPYEGIAILGCAEWGNFVDYLVLIYDDGSKQEVRVEFSDWAFPPVYSDYLVYEGNQVDLTKNNPIINGYKANLFAQVYQMNSSKRLMKIILPTCPNIHVFAISLYDLKTK